MLHSRESYFFLPIPLVLALCGMAFCGLNLWEGESALCFSSGCTLFKNFTLGGISLWWVGLCGFGVLALLALAGRPALGRAGAGIGLFLDCLLLCLLLVSAPCMDCLLVALLLALCYYTFRSAAQTQRRSNAPRAFSFLLALWALLFIANLGSLARDSVDPWPMQQAAGSSGYVYISPSCAACRQLVRELPADEAAKLSWYPVSKNEHDTRVIAALVKRLDNGEPLAEAFAKALEAPLEGHWELFSPNMIMLQVRLWRNQSHVLANGGELPLIEFGGLPAFMLPDARPAAQRTPQRPPVARTAPEMAYPVTDSVSPYAGHDNTNVPVDLEIVGQCGPDAVEPCE